MKNLTTLSVEFSLGLSEAIWTVLPFMPRGTWEERPSSDFLLACSHLPSLQKLKLYAFIDWRINHTSHDAILGAVDHIYKDSIDQCFLPPRFPSLKRLTVGMGITVWDRFGDFAHDLQDGGLDDLVKNALPSVFGPGARVANGLEVDFFSELDIKEEEDEQDED